MNVRLHRLANKTWDRLSIKEQELIDASLELTNNKVYTDHPWWKRISPIVEAQSPAPIYRH